MRVRRTAVGGFVDRTVHARAPQLLKLPVPVPSVPILAPVVSPIVGGSNQNTNTGNTAPANNPPPASAPAPPTSPSNPSPPSSNASGGGSTSSSSGSTPNTGGSGSPAVAPPAGVPASGTASGAVSGDTTTSGSSGGSSTTGSGTIPSDGTSSSTSSSSGSVLVGGGGVTSTTGSGTSSSGTTDDSGGVASVPAVANAAGGTHASQGNSSKNYSGSNTNTAGGSSSTAAGNGSNSTTLGSASATGKGSIPVGAIAAIVIICLGLFLFLLVFFFRRRARARRNEQANTWWFSRKRTSQTYGDGEILAAGSQSVRSSFSSCAIISPPPPMAEIGRVTASSLQTAIDPSRFNTEVPDNRFSIGSAHSENSQFLFVNIRGSVQMSPAPGQPFSPSSQSFAFPKPPSPAGDRTSAYSRPSSHHGTVRTITRRPDSDDSIFASLPPVPSASSAAPLIGDDPFASNPFGGDSNPFQDPRPSTASTSTSFKEIIRRPFQRTLKDEVTVNVGEYVRVLTTFDDGWAYLHRQGSADGFEQRR